MSEPSPKPTPDYAFHPLADTFPLIGDEELTALADDIRKNGMHERITLHEGKILDGRNRYLAAKQAGVALSLADHFRRLPAGVDAWDFVVSENIQRRHLTREQKQEVIASLLKADPSKSNRAIAATAKVSHHTVGEMRSELEATGQIAQLETTTGKDKKKRKVSKKKTRAADAPHVAYNRKREELIDLLKETHTSYAQAEEWVDNTKQRLDEHSRASRKNSTRRTRLRRRSGVGCDRALAALRGAALFLGPGSILPADGNIRKVFADKP